MPRLLVSVRNLEELRAARSGGADILDIKEPEQGSLGMAPLSRLDEITDFLRAEAEEKPAHSADGDHPQTGIRCGSEPSERSDSGGWPPRFEAPPLSVALGELSDWVESCDVPSISEPVRYLKMGLSELGHRSDWQSNWIRVRQKFEQAAGRSFQWIAVCYADWETAHAPKPQEIIAAAAATNCAGILIDTFDKSRGSLLDRLDGDALAALAIRTEAVRLPLAIAGSLRVEHLGEIVSCSPHIVAIRTAACEGEQRTAAVSETAVRTFRDLMMKTFQTPFRAERHRSSAGPKIQDAVGHS